MLSYLVLLHVLAGSPLDRTIAELGFEPAWFRQTFAYRESSWPGQWRRR